MAEKVSMDRSERAEYAQNVKMDMNIKIEKERSVALTIKAPNEHNRIRIKKWRVREGVPINPSQIVFLYQIEGSEDDTLHKLRVDSTQRVGMVKKRFFKEGDIVQGGANVLEIDDCKHATVIQDLCADCGADLRQKDNDSILEASVPMVHCIPDLKVTKKLAQKLGNDDTRRLLQDRKLVLLVDLDQTIIHTTNDNIPNNIKDIFHFQLYGPNSFWHHTRLRPGTLHFLEEMSKYYELHICTFGARNYAHMIAQFLDPNGKYFSHRILSRDECFNSKSKFENLSALFPNGDSMVCIIDDREDVWNMASNLIQVKPYHFFQHTGDINAPPGLSKHELDGKGVDFQNINITCNKTITEQIEDVAGQEESKQNEVCTSVDNDKEAALPAKEVIATETETELLNQVKVVDNLNENDNAVVCKDHKNSNDLIEIEDTDDYLIYLETILKNIHTRFYGIYDSTQEIPDLKKIIPLVRAEVLLCLNLVFSGLVPVNTRLEQSRACLIAKSLGANVAQIIDAETTTLVAMTAGTYKVKMAKKNKNMKIVNANWLWTCAERWEHVDERVFPLDPKANSATRQPPSHCQSPEHVVNYNEGTAIVQNSHIDTNTENEHEKFMDIINPLLSFSNADLADMNKEFDQFFEPDSSSDDDEEIAIKNSGDANLRKRKLQNDKIEQNAAAENSSKVQRECDVGEDLRKKACVVDDHSSDKNFDSDQKDDSDSRSDNGDNIDWTEMGEELERELLRNS